MNEELIKVPFKREKDGTKTFFTPKLWRKNGYEIGQRHNDKEAGIKNYWEALDKLKEMSEPRFRRPNKAGNWGTVTCDSGDFENIKKSIIENELKKLPFYTSIDKSNLSKTLPGTEDIENHDSVNGESLQVSGKPSSVYVDQFGLDELPSGEAKRKETITYVYERSPQVRKSVLERAKGYCEWCSGKGFTTSRGSIYLETHHIQPLSEGGDDTVYNVIALCPNHHREAHFGENSQKTKEVLFERIEKLGKSM